MPSHPLTLQCAHFDNMWHDVPADRLDSAEAAIFDLLANPWHDGVGIVYIETMEASGDGMQYRLKPLPSSEDGPQDEDDDTSYKAVVKACSNCNRDHEFYRDWPNCDPHEPHGFLTYTGMEGRCQFCGGRPDATLHNEALR